MSRFCLVLGGILAMTVGTSAAAPEAKNKKKSGGHGIHGTIVSVSKDSITVKTHHKKKKGQATAGKSHTKTFTLTQNTKIQKGGKNQNQPASFSALSPGQHVVVLGRNQQADTVIIHHHHKKKKNAA
jgi:hypothetical protein